MKFCGDGRMIIGNFTRSRTAGSILPAVSFLMRNRVLCFIGQFFRRDVYKRQIWVLWGVEM